MLHFSTANVLKMPAMNVNKAEFIYFFVVDDRMLMLTSCGCVLRVVLCTLLIGTFLIGKIFVQGFNNQIRYICHCCSLGPIRNVC